MEFLKTKIHGLILIKPAVFGDSRGQFFETYSEEKMAQFGLNEKFVQDNQSISKKGVLRGLHFQKPPFAQGKLVRVVKGAALDVAVDLRKNSATFGQWESLEITEENKLILWVPPGFAHGFVSLEENTVFVYKCTNFYNKASEATILWNDPYLNIEWKVKNPILSEKDLEGMSFEEFRNLEFGFRI
jgi:dTDP-4-dehydrorhamnose 3,5-epimerase